MDFNSQKGSAHATNKKTKKNNTNNNKKKTHTKHIKPSIASNPSNLSLTDVDRQLDAYFKIALLKLYFFFTTHTR